MASPPYYPPPGPASTGSTTDLKPAGIHALVAALVWSARAAVHVLLLNEAFRVLSDELRRRVFAPRLERKNVKGEKSVVPMPSRFPFSWVPIVWRMKDEDILDEARQEGGSHSVNHDDQSALAAKAAQQAALERNHDQLLVEETVPVDPGSLACPRGLQVGIDAVMYYSFIRLCIMLMVPAACFDLSIVLWANTTGGNHLSPRTHSDLDVLSMGNVPQGHPRLWAHFISVLLKSALCLRLLDKHSKWICKVQLRELTQQRAGCAETYTILVTDIPLDSPPVSEKFGAIWGGDFAASTPVVHTAVLDKLVKRRDELRGLLETAQWWLEHPPKGKEKTADSQPWRPTHRTGPLGLVGPRVDSVEEYTQELEQVEARCTAIRRAVLSGTPSDDAPVRGAAFVAFYSCREATLASQVQHTEDPFQWRVQPAMAPDDVFWPNIGRLGFFERQTAQNVALAAVLAISLFWMIPVAFVQSLATLTNLAKVLPFLKPAFKDQTVKSIIEGILPGLALIIFMAILPLIMRKISQMEGTPSYSQIDASQLRKLFIFGAVNVFFGNIVAGSVFNSIETIVKNPEGSLEVIGSAVPATSRFFMAYVLLNSLGGAAALISGGVKSIIYLLRRRFLAKTPRAEEACWKERAVEQGEVNCDTTVFFMLIVIFSTLQPVMHVIGFVYLVPRLVAAKIQVLFLHEKDHEGRGMLWSVLRGRVVASLIIYQLTMAVCLGLKLAPAQAVLSAFLAPLTLSYKRKMDSRYNWVLGNTIPLEVVTGKAFMDAESAADESVMPYLHPALRPEGDGVKGKRQRPSYYSEADEEAGEYGRVSGVSRVSARSGGARSHGARSGRHAGRGAAGASYRSRGSAAHDVSDYLEDIPETSKAARVRGSDQGPSEEGTDHVPTAGGRSVFNSNRSIRPGRPDDASDDNLPGPPGASGHASHQPVPPGAVSGGNGKAGNGAAASARGAQVLEVGMAESAEDGGGGKPPPAHAEDTAAAQQVVPVAEGALIQSVLVGAASGRAEEGGEQHNN